MFRLFKKKPKPAANTAQHPEIKRLITKAFECDGVQYWQFKDIEDSSSIRSAWLQQFYNELLISTSREQLIEGLQAIQAAARAGDPSKVLITAGIMESRAEYLFAPEIAYKIASCTYFTIDENLAEWDKTYNEEKISKWKEQGVDFFFLEPISKLFPFVKQFTKAGLRNFLKSQNALSETLTKYLQ